MFPALSTVCRSVHTVAGGKVWALNAFTAPNVDGFGVRRRDCDCSDGSGRLVVENGDPGAAEVIRFPDAAIVDAHIERSGLRRYPRRPNGSSATEGANHAPL